jgi:GT2 family glycosyltransferase
VVFNTANLGYGAGNNVGLRRLSRAGVPFAWLLNNDAKVLEGSSEALVSAAEARPEVGAWGCTVRTEGKRPFTGGVLQAKDFASSPTCDRSVIESDPMAYLSGCALFLRMDAAAEAGFIPEHYFLYYEDAAFSLEIRRCGHALSTVDSVAVAHAGSLATGPRSALVERYTRRTRWMLISRYFPEALARQKRDLPYRLQKYLFRGEWSKLWAEWRGFLDWRKGRTGPIP